MIGKTLLHYEITSKIGEGGMGEVYKVEDANLSHQVTVSLIVPKS